MGNGILVFNTLNEFGLISNPNSTYSMTGNFNSNSTIANSNVILQNVTINSGTVIKVNACNNITIGPNVTVKSGSTLEIDAVNGSVVIDYGSFTVEESAIFIIK